MYRDIHMTVRIDELSCSSPQVIEIKHARPSSSTFESEMKKKEALSILHTESGSDISTMNLKHLAGCIVTPPSKEEETCNTFEMQCIH